eukprot:358727-Chlamydomonas_euryale.AAC.7
MHHGKAHCGEVAIIVHEWLPELHAASQYVRPCTQMVTVGERPLQMAGARCDVHISAFNILSLDKKNSTVPCLTYAIPLCLESPTRQSGQQANQAARIPRSGCRMQDSTSTATAVLSRSGLHSILEVQRTGSARPLSSHPFKIGRPCPMPSPLTGQRRGPRCGFVASTEHAGQARAPQAFNAKTAAENGDIMRCTPLLLTHAAPDLRILQPVHGCCIRSRLNLQPNTAACSCQRMAVSGERSGVSAWMDGLAVFLSQVLGTFSFVTWESRAGAAFQRHQRCSLHSPGTLLTSRSSCCEEHAATQSSGGPKKGLGGAPLARGVPGGALPVPAATAAQRGTSPREMVSGGGGAAEVACTAGRGALTGSSTLTVARGTPGRVAATRLQPEERLAGGGGGAVGASGHGACIEGHQQL